MVCGFQPSLLDLRTPVWSRLLRRDQVAMRPLLDGSYHIAEYLKAQGLCVDTVLQVGRVELETLMQLLYAAISAGSSTNCLRVQTRRVPLIGAHLHGICGRHGREPLAVERRLTDVVLPEFQVVYREHHLQCMLDLSRSIPAEHGQSRLCAPSRASQPAVCVQSATSTVVWLHSRASAWDCRQRICMQLNRVLVSPSASRGRKGGSSPSTPVPGAPTTSRGSAGCPAAGPSAAGTPAQPGGQVYCSARHRGGRVFQTGHGQECTALMSRKAHMWTCVLSNCASRSALCVPASEHAGVGKWLTGSRF